MSTGTGKGGKSFQDRQLAAEVRTLTLQEIKKALLGDDEEYKKAVVLKLSTSILPRLNEVTGADGKDLFPNENAKAKSKEAIRDFIGEDTVGE